MVSVVPGTSAALAGVKAGDYLVSVGEVVVVRTADFGPAFRQLYAGKADMRRSSSRCDAAARRSSSTRRCSLSNLKVEADPNSNEKATRIRDGILTGKTGS